MATWTKIFFLLNLDAYLSIFNKGAATANRENYSVLILKYLCPKTMICFVCRSDLENPDAFVDYLGKQRTGFKINS